MFSQGADFFSFATLLCAAYSWSIANGETKYQSANNLLFSGVITYLLALLVLFGDKFNNSLLTLLSELFSITVDNGFGDSCNHFCFPHLNNKLCSEVPELVQHEKLIPKLCAPFYFHSIFLQLFAPSTSYFV